MSASRPRRFLVVGGGGHGSALALGLARARDRDRLGAAEVWIVDRDSACAAAGLPPRPDRRLVIADWDEFLSGYLEAWAHDAGQRQDDFLVLPPLVPHLFARWLERALGRMTPVLRAIEPPFVPELPFARLLPDRLVLSFADWRCPPRCVEPAVCPATRQPRSWDLARALAAYARDLRGRGLLPLFGPLVARSTHLVEGVAVLPLRDWIEAARHLAERQANGGGGSYALVATVSGCHGSASLFSTGDRVD